MKRVLDTGNKACASAVKLACPDVIAAYPITPQTTISEKLAEYVADGELPSRYIAVESEHSAISAVAAASAAGARVFTATSSQGLLYMDEILHYAAGARLPVVLANVNRAVNAPWCLYADHQDSVSKRDTGWMQIYAGSNQEIHDFILLAYRVAEELSVPTMVCYDGFILSHSIAPYEQIDEETAAKFLPEYKPAWALHPSFGRQTFGAVSGAKEYEEFRTELAKTVNSAAGTFAFRGSELDALTGHNVCSLIEPYRTEQAEYFVLSMGTMGVEAEVAVDMLRERGIKAANLRLKLFRPFPGEELSKLLPAGAKLIVLDRSFAYGAQGGAIYCDARSALYERASEITITGRTIGVGGGDLTARLLADTVEEIIKEGK